MIQHLKRIQPPANEPVTLSEAKQHERIDLNDDDGLVTALIKAARQQAEEYTKRSFITQTWELTLDEANGIIELPRPPIQSVTNVTVDGSPYSNYEVDGNRIYFPSGVSFLFGGIKIEYTAGYGDNSEDVPEPIREAILQMVGHFYENRESQEMPVLAWQLLSPYKVWQL